MAEPYLTMAEIEAKYPNEWVLIANPTTRGRSLAPTGGIVVLHSTDHAEFLRMVQDWDDPACKHIASWYTGKLPVDELLPADSEPGAA